MPQDTNQPFSNPQPDRVNTNGQQQTGAQFYRTSVPQCYQAGYGYNLGTATAVGVDQKNDKLSQPPFWKVLRTGAGVYVVTHNLGTLAYYPAITCGVAFTVTAIGANSFQVNTGGADNIFSYIVFCSP